MREEALGERADAEGMRLARNFEKRIVSTRTLSISGILVAVAEGKGAR